MAGVSPFDVRHISICLASTWNFDTNAAIRQLFLASHKWRILRSSAALPSITLSTGIVEAVPALHLGADCVAVPPLTTICTFLHVCHAIRLCTGPIMIISFDPFNTAVIADDMQHLVRFDPRTIRSKRLITASASIRGPHHTHFERRRFRGGYFGGRVS